MLCALWVAQEVTPLREFRAGAHKTRETCFDFLVMSVYTLAQRFFDALCTSIPAHKRANIKLRLTTIP